MKKHTSHHAHTHTHKHKFGFIGRIFCALPHNDHKPHLLRGTTLLIISFIAVFLMGMSFARYYFLHETVLGQEIVSSVLIDLTNETRVKYGESPLVRNTKLENASAMKAEDMATYQYFAHNSPSGVTPWYWIKKSGYEFLYAGENLAVDFTQSKDVDDAWMKSPTHKANILNSKFTEIGISTKEGMIDGHNTIYVVQMFGTPKNKVAVKEVVNEKPIAMVESTSTASTTPKLEGEVAGINIGEKSSETKIVLANNEASTSPTNVNNISAGSATALQTPTTSSSQEEYIVLMNENNMMVVADREAVERGEDLGKVLPKENIVHYSNFWQKLVYNFWFNLNIIYKVIMSAIMLALFFLFFVEFRKRHWLHMLYGVLTIVLLLVLLYVNQSLW